MTKLNITDEELKKELLLFGEISHIKYLQDNSRITILIPHSQDTSLRNRFDKIITYLYVSKEFTQIKFRTEDLKEILNI